MENKTQYNVTIEISFRDIISGTYEVDKEIKKQFFESLGDIIRKFSRDSGYVVLSKQITETIFIHIKKNEEININRDFF